MLAVSAHYPLYCVKWFSDENSLYLLKSCYFLSWNHINAEVFCQGKLIFWDNHILKDRKQLLDTGHFKQQLETLFSIMIASDGDIPKFI